MDFDLTREQKMIRSTDFIETPSSVRSVQAHRKSGGSSSPMN
jgi:hypothetical protein